MSAPMPGDPVSIRLASAADVPAMVDLIADEEFTKPLTRPQLRLLFEGAWVSEHSDKGYVATANQAVVGVVGVIHAPPRRVEGMVLSTLNMTTLFVKPEYRHSSGQGRRLSGELMKTVSDTGHLVLAFTARGPYNIVPRLLKDCGFEEMSSAELFCPLGGQLGTLLRPAGRVVADRDVQPHLTAEQRQIVDDHERFGCRFYVVVNGSRRSFIVTKRRRYRGAHLWPRMRLSRLRTRGFPVSDILHISDPETALGAWGRLVFEVARRERTVGVTCAETFLGTAGVPRMTSVTEKIFTANRAVSPQSIDKLYSELVLLP